MPDEIIIRAHVSADGSIMYDVWIDPMYDELPEGFGDPADGGACTSGDDKPDEPHNATDWRNALDMATDAAIDLMKHERPATPCEAAHPDEPCPKA